VSNPSPKPQGESSRQYQRLLKGDITSKQYVQSLKKEARSVVRSQKGRRAAA
jgi:hypothetical protein